MTSEIRYDDLTLELAAKIVEEATSWGLTNRQQDAVINFQRFAASAIRAQKSDSPERAAYAARDASETDASAEKA